MSYMCIQEFYNVRRYTQRIHSVQCSCSIRVYVRVNEPCKIAVDKTNNSSESANDVI